MSLPTRAPTANELLSDTDVQAALDRAWLDSLPEEPPDVRHEEGGWIYLDIFTGRIQIVRAARGDQFQIDLSSPPVTLGNVVVAKFHTHPNPASQGWVTGPSPNDLAIDAQHGVPDLIRAEDGMHLSGPESRRGGLAGGPGFPP